MRKIRFYLLLFFLGKCFSNIAATVDSVAIASAAMNKTYTAAVVLPESYQKNKSAYPVLYLLHGGGDDQTGWVQFGEVLNIADKAINEGKATPMIIIMPDANTGTRGYSNNANGTWLYEDFFFQELMPFVEKKYRIKTDKRYRAISGLSMGGDGSFTYALHHPELFSSACPLSAGTGPLTLEIAKGNVSRTTPGLPDSLIEKYYKRQSVVELVKNWPDSIKKSVRWYIDCGDDDFLFEGNSLVHIAMRKRDIPHEYRVRDGAHNWTYWRESLPVVLAFVSMGFHQY